MKRRDDCITVLLADDHGLVRAGIRRVLEESGDMLVVGEAANGDDAIQLTSRLQPDVVVLDVSMPKMDGIETVEHLAAIIPLVKILVLTMHPEEHFALRMLKGGCQGYVTKDVLPHELIEAVRTVAAGRQYLSARCKDILDSHAMSTSAVPETASLSDRELQVLCLVARGYKLREVADQLNLSVRTVETYELRLKQKLGLRNKVDISRFAHQNKLI